MISESPIRIIRLDIRYPTDIAHIVSESDIRIKYPNSYLISEKNIRISENHIRITIRPLSVGRTVGKYLYHLHPYRWYILLFFSRCHYHHSSTCGFSQSIWEKEDKYHKRVECVPHSKYWFCCTRHVQFMPWHFFPFSFSSAFRRPFAFTSMHRLIKLLHTKADADRITCPPGNKGIW